MDRDPVTVLSPGGTSPFLLMCDHACNALPEDYWRLGLPEHVFDEHIAYDIGARDVTLRLSERLDATAVLTNFSRLLIDPNREPDHEGLVPTFSDGIEIPGNQGLDSDEIERRLHLFHQPFHDALSQQIIAMGARGIVPASIGIHSFTPIMQGAGRPWQVGILWNRDPRIPEPLIGWLRRDPQLTVGDNQPYSGRLLGHTMNEHGGKHGLANAVIEIRQDLIDTPDKAHVWADRIADALTAISRDTSIFTIRHY